MSDIDRLSKFNKIKKYRFVFVGVFFIAALLIFMNLPGEMGTVNVSADFGTPTGDANAKIVSVGIGSSSVSRNNLASWTESNDDELMTIDADSNFESAVVKITYITTDLYDATHRGKNSIKIIFSYEINNVPSGDLTMVPLSSSAVGIEGYQYVTAYYVLDGLSEELEDDDWLEITVELYVKLRS